MKLVIARPKAVAIFSAVTTLDHWKLLAGGLEDCRAALAMTSFIFLSYKMHKSKNYNAVIVKFLAAASSTIQSRLPVEG